MDPNRFDALTVSLARARSRRAVLGALAAAAALIGFGPGGEGGRRRGEVPARPQAVRREVHP